MKVKPSENTKKREDAPVKKAAPDAAPEPHGKAIVKVDTIELSSILCEGKFSPSVLYQEDIMTRRGLLSATVLFVAAVVTLPSPPRGTMTSEQQREEYGARAKLYEKESLLDGCRGPICTMRANSGGHIDVFQEVADEVHKGPIELVIIDQPCYSACVIFADKARPKVCITPKVSFFFHKTYQLGLRVTGMGFIPIRTDFKDPPQAPDIDLWVRQTYGDYPKDGFVRMPFIVAQRFWSVCPAKLSDLHPHKRRVPQ